MKSIKKYITAAVIGIMAAAALTATASADVYIRADGSCRYEARYEGNVYAERLFSDEQRYREEVYVGVDPFFGYIYYHPSYGYYTYKEDLSIVYLGTEFEFTRFVLTDRYGTDVYIREDIGPLYRVEDKWYLYNIFGGGI
ncbi:MAG: hypothetical protein IJ251_04795 [Oscillospiraceae bacterium]|nr:hypothetical protein [Oscillospiraceae bacterium]